MLGYAPPAAFEAVGDVGAAVAAMIVTSLCVVGLIVAIARRSASRWVETPDPGASVMPWPAGSTSNVKRGPGVGTRVRRYAASISTAVALVAASCGGAGGDGTIRLGGKIANDNGTRAVLFAGSTSIEMNDFSFAPTLLRWTVGSGGMRTFIFRNPSGATHNVSMPERSVDADVPPGGSLDVSLRLEPDQIPVVFWCKYHVDRGMVGAFEGWPG